MAELAVEHPPIQDLRLRTAPSEDTYSHSASEHLRSIADNTDSFTISVPHRATCWLCERDCGRILDRDAYSTPDPFTAFPFRRKSEVQDTVCNSFCTIQRAAPSEHILLRLGSISRYASALRRRRVPNACSPLTVRVYGHLPLPAALLDAPAPALTATSKPRILLSLGGKTVNAGRSLSQVERICPSQRLQRAYWGTASVSKDQRLAMFSPSFPLARAPPSLQERALNGLAYICSQSQYRTSFTVRAWEPLGIGLSNHSQRREMYRTKELVSRRRAGIGLITRLRAAARRTQFLRCNLAATLSKAQSRAASSIDAGGLLIVLPHKDVRYFATSTRYMNALAPPFPPPVPNSITRRSKRLVLATLHAMLGVSASRPLALTLLDASTPMSRERRIHRAVAVAVARRRTTARCILEARTLGSRSVRLGKSRI
ncbi:hypothetical protein DFH08DRAFT_1088000 [Mycena albidolilacea]|uniref:Uncharacterized protein n=1 Tax=Mycena albidolilacea TaxID=1033008 RepID=A0AAD6Z7S4_9AGAR|nr:hypothetical protein DFH08DRAFT_1088000 [Mycena albidolilacea]